MVVSLLLAMALVPQNVVLCIADGAGYAQFAAASLHEHGGPGWQVYDGWPVQLAMSTVPCGCAYDTALAYTDDGWLRRNATDSAAAITAMTTGVKTRNGRLVVDPEGRALGPLAALLADAGKSAGVVTTVLFTHATPAGFCISHPDRGAYRKIGAAMLTGGQLDVVMGAGHPFWDDAGHGREPGDFTHVGGDSLWAELVAGRLGADSPDGAWTLIEARADFQALGDGPAPRRVVGLARARETLQQARDGDGMAAPYVVPLDPEVPTLAEMARAALNVLVQDPDGFGLLIEGGAVDWASHDEQPGRMIEEMIDFNHAVAALVAGLEARGLLDRTLIVVTADHETWGHHTNALVPFYAIGPGSEAFLALADQVDPVRGPYLDNAELGAVLAGIARGCLPIPDTIENQD